MKFKVLMKDGKFIDAGAIGEEILESPIPYLFSLDTTIESLVEAALKFHEQIGHYHALRAADNIKQCELVEYNVIPVASS